MSSERNYLTADNSLRSWFFTTDHKRVAILYFAGITLFFFIGGAAATMIRLELISPQGHFVTSDGYNRLFTMHGVIMVWFFLIPSIPAKYKIATRLWSVVKNHERRLLCAVR